MVALTVLSAISVAKYFVFLSDISGDKGKRIRRNEIIWNHWDIAFHHIKNSCLKFSLKTFKPESLRKNFCILFFLCYSPFKITFSRNNSEINKEKLQCEQNDKNYLINVAACISTNVVFCFDSRQNWEWITSLTNLFPMDPSSTTWKHFKG